MARIRIVAGSIRDLDDEALTFARQLGCSGITLNTPPLTGQPSYGSNQIGASYWHDASLKEPPRRWDFLELLQLRQRVESAGLRLESIENVPLNFYDKAILGLPGRDEQIENYCETVRNLGRAGIPILGYHWMANRVWRTSKHDAARGGASTSGFDYALARHAPPTHDREYSDDEIWTNYQYFMRAVLPVAEEAGVVLALHPDDPPVPSLGGIARIFREFHAFERALDQIAPSAFHKLDFCMGTWAEMGSDHMMRGLAHFGRQGRIAYIHFRNVRGCVPRFVETFVDDGDVDTVAVIRLLHDIGFDGFLIDDHVPHLSQDSVYMHRSRAFAIGYMRGLLQAIQGPAESATTDRPKNPEVDQGA